MFRNARKIFLTSMIIFTLVFSLNLISPVPASPISYPNDGVWEDDFKNDLSGLVGDIDNTDVSWNEENDTLHLKYLSESGGKYEFSDDAEHKAFEARLFSSGFNGDGGPEPLFSLISRKITVETEITDTEGLEDESDDKEIDKTRE